MGRDKYIGIGLAVTLAIISSSFPIGYYLDGKNRMAHNELEKVRAEKGYSLQERDLNDNGEPEKFYEINGKKVFLEIDGKNLETSLRK